MIAQAFVAGKPESGHLRHPLGSACPQDHGRDAHPGARKPLAWEQG